MRRTIFEEEHDRFRETVRGFLGREAAPRTDEWERAGMVDRAFWHAAAGQGLVGFEAPEELGGAGIGDFRFNAVLDEEVAATGTVGDNFALVNDIVIPYLLGPTTPDQRRRWVPGVTSGDVVPAIAMSEPGAGSDLRAIATTASWAGDHWRLTGSKTFVTSGIQADLVIVAARIAREGVEGMGLFVVEAGAEGFTRGRKLEKIGHRAQDTAELFFDDVAVRPEDVVGEPGRGLSLLMRNLPRERLSIAVTAVASAERALAITLDHVRSRTAFGRPVGSFQANRFALADTATEVAIARVYVDRCMQRIYGGTSEIMREIVGRSLGL